MTGRYDRIEVITGVERRRRWSDEEKLRIVAESDRPGVSVSLVARRHGINANQLFQWRRLAREGAFGGLSPAVAGFVPIRVVDAGAPLPSPASVVAAPSPPSASLPVGMGHWPVEIELANGCRLRVAADIGAAVLHRLVTTLKAAG